MNAKLKILEDELKIIEQSNKKFKDEVQIPLVMKLVIYLYTLVLKIKGRGITNFLPK